MIPIYKPYLSAYKKSALDAIESEWISNHGIYVDLATQKLKEVLNMPHCILMNNGTSATHCLFKALKFRHPDLKKIYIPNNVFVAPWNCALMEYDASMIEVMRIDPKTMNIDMSREYLMSLDHGAAIVIVHNLGNIVNVPYIASLRPDLIFVEDNCEGLFGKYEGKYSGTFEGTLCSAVSFYGNKTITTGEGGAFFTHNIELYKFMKTYFSHGMSAERYIHNVLGTNYRMTNIQAGFLYDQLSDIHTILDLKRTVFENYKTLFKADVARGNIRLFSTGERTENSNWMFCLSAKGIKYADLEKYLLEKQVQIRPLFYDIRSHAHLRDLPCHQTDAIDISNAFMLPSYPELRYPEQEYIVNAIREYLALWPV